MSTTTVDTVPISFLTQDMLERARQIAERLRDAMRTVLTAVPLEAQTAAGLARYTGIERTMCTRLIAGLKEPIRPETLIEIPGARSIRTLAQAIQAAGCEEGARLEVAASQLEEFFSKLPGRQRGFARMLLHIEPAPTKDPMDTVARYQSLVAISDPDLERRARHFDVAKETFGRWSQTLIEIYILGPSDTQRGILDLLTARGLVKHQERSGAIPLMMTSRYDRPHQPDQTLPSRRDESGKEIQGLEGRNFLLENFCSFPLPAIDSHVRENVIVHHVDLNKTGPRTETDIFLVHQSSAASVDPDPGQERLEEFFISMNYPAESLIFDVYRHKDLVKRSIPGLDLHLMAHTIPLRHDRWATRVPIQPELRLLGEGLARSASRFYSRQTELTAELFRKHGKDPNDYVGFRCELAYPDWLLGYRIFFDYVTNCT